MSHKKTYQLPRWIRLLLTLQICKIQFWEQRKGESSRMQFFVCRRSRLAARKKCLRLALT